MKILLSYLSKHRWVVVLALVLAGFNIAFSLCDPLITKYIVDLYMVPANHKVYSYEYRLHGSLILVALGVGAAMVSRIAKNFQDYFTNIITQKTGAEMYADGLKHSLELPYQVFEDQRSGETLGILQKVRLDCQAFITSFISVLFVPGRDDFCDSDFYKSKLYGNACLFWRYPDYNVCKHGLKQADKNYTKKDSIANHCTCRLNHRIITKY